MRFSRSAVIVVLALVIAGAGIAQGHAPAFGSVYIPRINLGARVSECVIVDGRHDLGGLGNGVCHLEGTATIEDDWARIVLAGHTPGAFDNLTLLEIGDQIVVWNAHTVEVYQVVLVTLADEADVEWLMPTDAETLTLITCNGARRLIVHAEKE